ncbi:ArgE/DapE family deacylase [Salinibacterium sp.]|uniref:ArgE/DapE family deacylase n=1 Tax=Salinibacterium sp. TaxID=1915057 RepID=UPI00286B9E91|nr:ArgE/DapE family deacylase [Salinibacterium sp.]
MPTISPFEARMLDSLDEQLLVHSLVESIRVPSVTGTAEESQLQHDQATELARYGCDVDSWKFDLDALTAHAQFPGIETDREEGYGLVATIGGSGIPALILQGHIDVVPTGDLDKWDDRDAFSGSISGGVLHGRGACDMKAGVAANMAVVRTLAASGVTLSRPLGIHSVVSEEDGGLGAFATLLRGHTGEAAVISEPTSNRIVTANAGALTFRIVVPGRAAHGSTRLEGVSALDAFLPIYAAIAELERARNAVPDARFADTILPYPISIGRLSAGDWPSSVPDILTADGRLGVRLGEAPEDAREALTRAIGAASARDPWLRDHPVVLTWPGGQFASGWLDSEHPLIGQMAQSVVDVSGGSLPETAAAPYGSDLRLYSGIGGIPTLHYGPGDVRFAHAPREQVNIAELMSVTRSLLLLAIRRCGARESVT